MGKCSAQAFCLTNRKLLCQMEILAASRLIEIRLIKIAHACIA